MPRIKRGGRELVVPESVVREYLRDGYSLIDDQGNVIRPNAPMNYAQAISELSALKEREAQLEAALSEAGEKLRASIEREEALKAELDSYKNHIDGSFIAKTAHGPVEEEKSNEPTPPTSGEAEAHRGEMKRQGRKRIEA